MNDTTDPGLYHYTPLEPANASIRLLEVDPGTGPITCRLTHHALDACPPYSTLSYTWGSSVAMHAIICSGSILIIGANLYAFLRQFRTFPEPRRTLLWVDAICINQASIPERNAQVPLMRDIYSNSRRTLVWLGPEDEDTKLAFEILDLCAPCEDGIGLEHPDPDSNAMISSLSALQPSMTRREYDLRACKFASQYRGHSTSDIYSRLLDRLEQFDIRNWNAIYNLLSRPYWTRVWIIQELFLSAHVEFYCGPFCIPLSAFNILRIEKFGPEEQKFMGSTGYRLMGQREHWRSRVQFLGLFELLSDHLETQSTIPLDKVYGLLGLLEANPHYDNQHRIIPDYSKTSLQLMVDLLLLKGTQRSSTWLHPNNYNLLRKRLGVSVEDFEEYVLKNADGDCKDLIPFVGKGLKV